MVLHITITSLVIDFAFPICQRAYTIHINDYSLILREL
jgi:hypothetical protein